MMLPQYEHCPWSGGIERTPSDSFGVSSSNELVPLLMLLPVVERRT